MKQADQFIAEYLALVKKHKMYIANCGCCSNIGWVEDCEKETYKEIKKELEYISNDPVEKPKKVDNKDQQCKTCLKGIYKQVDQLDIVLCNKCNANHPRYE